MTKKINRSIKGKKNGFGAATKINYNISKYKKESIKRTTHLKSMIVESINPGFVVGTFDYVRGYSYLCVFDNDESMNCDNLANAIKYNYDEACMVALYKLCYHHNNYAHVAVFSCEVNNDSIEISSKTFEHSVDGLFRNLADDICDFLEVDFFPTFSQFSNYLCDENIENLLNSYS